MKLGDAMSELPVSYSVVVVVLAVVLSLWFLLPDSLIGTDRIVMFFIGTEMSGRCSDMCILIADLGADAVCQAECLMSVTEQ